MQDTDNRLTLLAMAKKFRLTQKRQAYADSRQSVTLLGSPLRHNISAEDRYRKRLERLTDQMAKEVEREITKLFKSPESREYFGDFAEDASIASMTRKTINRLSEKYVSIFNQASKRFAQSMLKDINKTSKSAMFESLKKLSGGLSIKTDFISDDMSEILKASAEENIGLIKTIPRSYFQRLQGELNRTITTPEAGGWSGMMKTINQTLKKEYRNHHNKARNIALDQTRKAYNNLNAGRMRAVGVEKYRWIHSGGGQRPREWHLNYLNGKVFSLDNPPIIEPKTGERGIPGQAINCRCTMLPIIEFKNV